MNIKGIERSDLAKQSWQKIIGFYRNNPTMLKIVSYVIEHNCDEKIHARTSLTRLTISPRHRYDAKMDVITIDTENDNAEIIYFEYESNQRKSIINEMDDVIDTAKYFIEKMLNKYELSS